jgi:hypothetical protein
MPTYSARFGERFLRLCRREAWADPLASDLHLERLDKKLVGDMHSCSLLPSAWQAHCPSLRCEPLSGAVRRDRFQRGFRLIPAVPATVRLIDGRNREDQAMPKACLCRPAR